MPERLTMDPLELAYALRLLELEGGEPTQWTRVVQGRRS